LLPVSVEPQREWADAIVYFAILDRFADGDPRNDSDVDRRAKGTFHGGDLVGLRQQLDDLADLGVTAIWITPVAKNIDGFVTGAGFPDWAITATGPTTSPSPTGASAASRRWPSSSRTATAAGSSCCSTWSTTTRATVRNT
jgi:glycosidase